MSILARLAVPATVLSAVMLLSVGCESKPKTELGRSAVTDETAGTYESADDSAKMPREASGPIITGPASRSPAVVGPGPVVVAPPPVIPLPAPPPAVRTHVIVKGDTYFSLARTYYGDAKLWVKIMEANHNTPPERLKIGQELIIPDVKAAPK